MATGTDIFLAFLAILFPPLPVWVKCGLCSVPSLINLVLCVLGFIPVSHEVNTPAVPLANLQN